MELVPEMVQHMVEQCPGRHILDELQAEVLQVAEHGPHAVRRAGGQPGPPGLGDGERDAGPGGGIALIPEPHLGAEGSAGHPEVDGAEMHLVSAAQGPGGMDLLAIDEGAVAAVEVFEEGNATVQHDPGMASAQGPIGDDHLVLVRAAEMPRPAVLPLQQERAESRDMQGHGGHGGKECVPVAGRLPGEVSWRHSFWSHAFLGWSGKKRPIRFHPDVIMSLF